ncbi:hypothetical protein PENSPDRAFT_193892 [Peniophora sp. CONT]|nr:hypothetical protein PENSPDRAFT_193892 [Peniophora sp. CONT]
MAGTAAHTGSDVVNLSYLPSGLDFPVEAQREGWLFMPSNGGNAYVDDDSTRCMAQQPLDANGDPGKIPSYLIPRLMSPSQRVQPPVLNFGWVLDEVHFMDVVRQHFPKCIQRRLATQETLKSALNTVFPHTCKDRGPVIVGESSFATCFSSPLRDEISNHIKVPKVYLKLELVTFTIFCDSQGKPYLGITAGNNYSGVLHVRTRARLCQLFSLNESDAKWYLDQQKCYWTTRGTPTKHAQRNVLTLYSLCRGGEGAQEAAERLA